MWIDTHCHLDAQEFGAVSLDVAQQTGAAVVGMIAIRPKQLPGINEAGTRYAINSVMQAAKDYDQAELYQLARAATWDSLYSNVQGSEYDALLNILQQPA